MTSVEIASGVRMPMIGFGTWQITGEGAYHATRTALDAGYRHIDTATLYGNEAQIGRAIADSGVPRDDLFVTTKLPPARIKAVRKTLETSLASLGLDAVDLWLIHWPPTGGGSAKAWAEMVELREAGRTRAIGVSNYEVDQIDELTEATGVTPAVNQISLSPWSYDAAVVAANVKRGVAVEGYSGLRNANLRDRALVSIAEAHGVTPAQVVLRWHLEHDIIVIPKSAHERRIRENLDLLSFALTPDEVSTIDAFATVR